MMLPNTLAGVGGHELVFVIPHVYVLGNNAQDRLCWSWAGFQQYQESYSEVSSCSIPLAGFLFLSAACFSRYSLTKATLSPLKKSAGLTQ